MKFSQIAAGVRAERPLSFQVGVDEQQQPILASVVLRPLSMVEEIDVEAEAIAVCKAKGAEASPTSSVYESARILAVLSRAVVDPDSPKDSREPFFDVPPGTLDPDILANLHAQQQAWQEETSPSYRHKSAPELIAMVKELSAEADSDPFHFWRYSKRTQWSLALFMARTLAPLLDSSSLPGSNSDALLKSFENVEDPSKSPTDSFSSPTEDLSPSDSDTSSEDDPS